MEYLSAMEETKYTIAQANTKLDKNGKIIEDLVSCRQNLNFLLSKPDTIDYIDVSPKQLVSVAASLIPFLENDDANRALMGSNMMRQAVPLLKPESPLVGTGIESDVALDSGVTIVSKRDGIVDKIDGKRIVIKAIDETDFTKSGVDIYNLQKFKFCLQDTSSSVIFPFLSIFVFAWAIVNFVSSIADKYSILSCTIPFSTFLYGLSINPYLFIFE